MNRDKKIVIIVFLTLVILIIIAYGVNMQKSTYSTYMINTQYQDKFIVKERVLKKYPDYIYDFKLYENAISENNFIVRLDSVKRLQKEIKPLLTNNELKCYLVSDYIIFKAVNQEKFEALKIEDLSNVNISRYQYLIPVARLLLLQSWDWSDSISEFLVKSKDTESLSILKRYANGEFYEKELRVNKYSIYSKEDMKKFCSRLLSEYSIDF